jgi:hypothetical protein
LGGGGPGTDAADSRIREDGLGRKTPGRPPAQGGRSAISGPAEADPRIKPGDRNARFALIRPIWFCLFLVWLVPLAQIKAEDRPTRLNVWDIRIGEPAAKIPDGFINYACGTNGGPPSLPLASFAEFKKCRPDANGLREVYFEYDDELEYRARALDRTAEIRMYAGTTAYEYPVVASVLFDDAGRVRGLRLVTDPRQHGVRGRSEFWTLANFIRQRFGDDGWTCKDVPRGEGETPVGSIFVKNHCERTANGLHLVLEQRYLQKKGQLSVDPDTGQPRLEDFESATRFEMYDAPLPLRKPGVN